MPSKVLPTRSGIFAGPSPLALTKSLVLNVLHTSRTQDTVNLNGKRSNSPASFDYLNGVASNVIGKMKPSAYRCVSINCPLPWNIDVMQAFFGIGATVQISEDRHDNHSPSVAASCR